VGVTGSNCNVTEREIAALSSATELALLALAL
jgi:hypothetical protein